MKLRLTGKGFENYTGQMGIHYFQNGLSISDVRPVDGMRIAGTIGAKWEDGTTANVGEIYAGHLQTPAPTGLDEVRKDPLAVVVGTSDASQVILQSNFIAQAQFKAEGVDVPTATQSAAASSVDVANPSHPDMDVKYTREQLEAVVDESGLVGLREIGATVGVKAGSINDLIDRILEVAGEKAEEAE